MAEEFLQVGENWWSINGTRSVFPLMSSSSTCSVAANDAGNYSTWQTNFLDLKPTRSCVEDTNHNNLVSDDSFGFLDAHKPQQHSESATGSGNGSILMDSTTIQMMGFGLSSSTSLNWNQSIFHSSGSQESNFYSMTQEPGIDSSNNSQIQKEWSSNKSQTTVNAPMNHEFCIDQQGLSSVTSSDQSCGFPIESTSTYGYPSNLTQSLYEPAYPQPQPHNSLFNNPSTMSYSSAPNYGTSSSNELSPTTWSKVPNSFAQKEQLSSGLHFSNNTPFWNASAEALNDIRVGAFASSQAQYQTPTFEDKPISQSTLLNKVKEDDKSSNTISVGKKSGCEPDFKRPRIETPSPLPTFKVRKEKLGDRITALQQLVSPFGKTDTASVLHEAIDYIKFLHDQVSVLSNSYLENGSPIQYQQGCDNVKDSEGPTQDLRSLGLCLVPISSTFPVTNETTIDFKTPTLVGAFNSS
ncbi:PREDICTED: transcription factor bHLH112 isoform X3 [Lupinus angustifolius]|uniref:transcription factor bHLH112 isoform X3 n=1 Tax=Lupinus angustifolius TaxID=3871 RepID=UPI00092EB88F|nr:PREDICTED: transcription factor bHLH112 isoform X3 [Lupinus angustifolius]